MNSAEFMEFFFSPKSGKNLSILSRHIICIMIDNVDKF